MVVRRIPRTNIYSALELALLALLAVQSARLVYTLVTPVGPIGEWQAAGTRPRSAAWGADLASFDPFFRLGQASGAPGVVTSLNLQLFGIREDRATGRGSAIIATPDGNQRSYLVGEEIMPGVTLSAVGFDNVTISRGGAREQLFLDQSRRAGNAAAPTPAPTPVPMQAAPPQAAPPTIAVPVVVAPPRTAPPPPSPVVQNGTGQ